MSHVPYSSTIGILMFTMVSIRPDIAQAMGVFRRFMVNHGKENWNVVKWMLNYLRGTSDTSICYRLTDLQIKCFAYSDYGGDKDGRKSTT